MNEKVEIGLSDGTEGEAEYLYMQQIKHLITEIIPVVNGMKNDYSLEVIASAFVNVSVMLVLDSKADKESFISKIGETWDSFSAKFKELAESKEGDSEHE